MENMAGNVLQYLLQLFFYVRKVILHREGEQVVIQVCFSENVYLPA